MSTTIPPIPYEPVSAGPAAKVHFKIAHDSGGSDADPWSGGLFPKSGRIYSITLHLYQYEGCQKLERGTVTLKPSRPVVSMKLRGDALLFADVRFRGSMGLGRSDLVFHLQENAEYTVSTIYAHHTPKRFKMAAHQNLHNDGAEKHVPVKSLSYRKGLLSAMLNCRGRQ